MGQKVKLRKFVCLNKSCKGYKRKNSGHIKYSFTKKGKYGNIAYLQCTKCKRKFSENKGTIFYRKKTAKDTIVKVLQSTAEGMGIRPAGRVFNKNKNTIRAWVREAGSHAEKVQIFFPGP